MSRRKGTKGCDINNNILLISRTKTMTSYDVIADLCHVRVHDDLSLTSQGRAQRPRGAQYE